METAVWALGVALFGTLVAVASLTWNIVTFLHSGPRISLEGDTNMLLIDPQAREQVPVATVTARNVGRMPCEVTSWTLLTPTGSGLAFLRMSPEYGPELPYTLDPGHSVSWRAPISSVVDALASEHSGDVKLEPQVFLGTGKRVVADPITVTVRSSLEG